MKILSAEYILPISSPPLKDGAVVFENDKIIDLGNKSDLQEKYPDAANEDFGKSAIMPGLVNCHSHLEITAMRGFLDEFDDDFSSWLVKLTKTRAEKLNDEDIETAAMLGALEGVRAGVTCFADIGHEGTAGFNALKQNGLRGVLFQETEFSPDNKTASVDFEILLEKFSLMRSSETDLVKVGISPHAPYTVSRDFFALISEYVKLNNVQITIHASESRHERNLLESGEGFFADIYEKENVEWESPGCSTIEYFSRIGILEAKPLLAHCVHVSRADIDLIKASGSKIAHCPKSNAKFGHGIAPFRSFLDKEIVVGLGSDSMASNNTCDMFEEARFAALLSRIDEKSNGFIHGEEMIKAATYGGAKVLGLENDIGTLEAGKQADIIVISLENAAQMPVHDVYSALLFASNARDVRLTMVAGEEIYRDGTSKKIDEVELKRRISDIRQRIGDR